MTLSQNHLAILFILSFTLLSCSQQQEPTSKKTTTKSLLNELTGEEVAAGWTLLFDGKNLNEWKGYQSELPKEGWYVDVESNMVGEKSGVDIITKKKFVNFDLKLEFQILPNTNSGIFYKVKEVIDTAMWCNAIEFQLIDSMILKSAGDISMETHATGDVYNMLDSKYISGISTNTWNRARIVILNDYVEHWLNDELILEYNLSSRRWTEKLNNSKFRNYPQFGKSKLGHIGLEGNDNKVKFRNVKIKEL